MTHHLYVTRKFSDFEFPNSLCVSSGNFETLKQIAAGLNECDWLIKNDKGGKVASSKPLDNIHQL